MSLEPLTIGIKRGTFRVNDAQAKRADSAFELGRPAALRQTKYRCARCFYESQDNPARKRKSSLHVHHLDNDHQNNEPGNYMPICSLDHAYHHIGCDAPTSGGSAGWASQMVIAFIPEIEAETLNAFQRAVGAALTDPDEAELAFEMVSLLGATSLPVRDVMGSFQAKDFAAAFGAMKEADYHQRDRATAGLRVLFHPNILKAVGAEMLADSPLFTVKQWEGVSRGFGV